jgi:hypothetical protein
MNAIVAADMVIIRPVFLAVKIDVARERAPRVAAFGGGVQPKNLRFVRAGFESA